MDYAATTPTDKLVLKAMNPFFSEKFGNPSSIHFEGVAANKAVLEARTKIARELQAHPDEVVFTSGGTEANNLAIFGAVKAVEKLGKAVSKMHFITTKIEHSSVLECFRELEARGAKVDYAPVKSDGVIDPKTIVGLVRKDTVLVSVQYANNEIGTIQPLREIGKQLESFSQKTNLKRPLFHTDASQAPLYLRLTAENLQINLMTLDGHKMYGPKGIGMLYIKRGTDIQPIILGGGQERGMRSTTESVPMIVGLAEALALAGNRREKDSMRLKKLRDYFFAEALANKKISDKIIINGSLTERLPNNVNISVSELDAEFAVLKFDAFGIACSTKSSCLGTEGGSYVVKACGGGEERSDSTLRFTFGHETQKKDVDYLLKCLEKIIAS